MARSKGFLPLVLLWIICAATILNRCSSTIVKPCKTGTALPDDKILISGCAKEPCSLKRGTDVTITIYFVTEKEIEKLNNNIYAMAAGLKTPYPGLDGKNSCNNIYLAADDSKVNCPLQPGVEYYYSMPLSVKKSYPKISALLHWAIKEKGVTETVACFEMNVSIV